MLFFIFYFILVHGWSNFAVPDVSQRPLSSVESGAIPKFVHTFLRCCRPFESMLHVAVSSIEKFGRRHVHPELASEHGPAMYAPRPRTSVRQRRVLSVRGTCPSELDRQSIVQDRSSNGFCRAWRVLNRSLRIPHATLGIDEPSRLDVFLLERSFQAVLLFFEDDFELAPRHFLYAFLFCRIP